VIGQFSWVCFVKNVACGGDAVFSSASGARAEGEVQGLSPQDCQATVDAVFEDFKVQLAAHDIAVVDPQACRDSPTHLKSLPYAAGSTMEVRFPVMNVAR
jgi:hypothetical protein